MDVNPETEPGSEGPGDAHAIAAVPATQDKSRSRGLVRGYKPPQANIDPEFLTMYYGIEALRSNDDPYILQFISPNPGAGVTTMALGFALARANENINPVLLLNCGAPYEGTDPEHMTLVEAIHTNLPLETAIETKHGFSRLHYAQLAPSKNALIEIGGAELRILCDELKSRYDVVVLDCPAATQVPDSLALSRYCDGTVLVIEAEDTRRKLAEWTKGEIARFGGFVIGTVLNKRRKYIPNWFYRHFL